MTKAANDNAPTGRVCTKCLEWKPFAEFHKSKDAKYGVASRCKVCLLADVAKRRGTPEYKARHAPSSREYAARPEVKARQAERDAIRRGTDEYKEKTRAQRQTPEYKAKAAAAEARRRENPEYKTNIAKWGEAYRQNPEYKARRLEYNLAYRARPEFKARKNELRAERRKNDPIFLAEEACRNLLKRHLDTFGQDKGARTSEMLGYSPDSLRSHIERQFAPGMTWSNRSAWHIDHKKPISAFLSEGVSDPRVVNALSNLQPLWAAENISKGASWPLVAANDNAPVRKAA